MNNKIDNVDSLRVERFNREVNSLLQKKSISDDGLISEDKRALELAVVLAEMDLKPRSEYRERLRGQMLEKTRQLSHPAPVIWLLKGFQLLPGMVGILLLGVLLGGIFGSFTSQTTIQTSSSIPPHATDTALLSSPMPIMLNPDYEALPVMPMAVPTPIIPEAFFNVIERTASPLLINEQVGDRIALTRIPIVTP